MRTAPDQTKMRREAIAVNRHKLVFGMCRMVLGAKCLNFKHRFQVGFFAALILFYCVLCTAIVRLYVQWGVVYRLSLVKYDVWMYTATAFYVHHRKCFGFFFTLSPHNICTCGCRCEIQSHKLLADCRVQNVWQMRTKQELNPKITFWWLKFSMI